MERGQKDSFREHLAKEKKKLKEMTFKEKLDYIWTYYKLHILAFLFIAVIAGSLVYTAMNPPLPAYIEAAMCDVYMGEAVEEALIELLHGAGLYEPSQERISATYFNNSDDPNLQIAMSQRFMAMLAATELDIIIASGEAFEGFINEGIIMPISDAGLQYPEELLVYGTYDTGEPLAYGINMRDSKFIGDFLTKPEYLTIGIVVNTLKIDNAVAVVNLLLSSR